MGTPEHVQFEAGLDKNGCIKCNADGSGSVLFSVSKSERDAISKLWDQFTEKTVIVTVVVKGETFGKRAE